MVFQFAPIIARLGIAGAGFVKHSPKANAVSGFSFGAPYAFGTYVGFPGNYKDKSSNRSKSTFTSVMPYGNYSNRRSYSNYGRSRKVRVWSRKYRRYIWVYPRNRRY